MQTVRTRVWDLPTRVCHFLLAACLVGSLVSVNIGGNAIAWHFRFGYAILSLVLFRFAWGFVGSRYARFSDFPPSPTAAFAYLRGIAGASVGHNPLGALSIYAMLFALALQASTGLFANDSIMWDGPLKNLVANEASDRLTTLHRWNRWLVIGLVSLHLCAVAFYSLFRRERLVGPMIVGDKVLPADARAPHADDGPGLRMRALLLFAACASVVWGSVTLIR